MKKKKEHYGKGLGHLNWLSYGCKALQLTQGLNLLNVRQCLNSRKFQSRLYSVRVTLY